MTAVGFVPIDSGPVRFWVTSDALQDPEGVRFRVTAEQAWQLAREAHALLPTPKVSDLIYAQADVLIPPILGDPAKTTDAEQSAKIDQAIAGRPGLVATVGKDWALSKKQTASKAVNYGWHTPAKPKPGGPWRAQTIEASVWQQPSTAHNWQHSDYSQTLRLVSRNALLDGQPADLWDLLTDPSTAHWLSDEGEFDAGDEPASVVAIADVPPVATVISAPGIKRTSNRFRFELWKLCEELNIPLDDVAIVLGIESGFRPYKRNPISDAVGINQIMPFRLKALGLTTDEVAEMTAVEQLRFVRLQYKGLAGRLSIPGDAFMANILPAYVGADASLLVGANPGTCKAKGFPKTWPTWPEQAKARLDRDKRISLGAFYCGNWGLDVNHEGLITLGDIRAWFLRHKASAAKRARIDIFPEPDEPDEPMISGAWLLALAGVLALRPWRLSR